MSNTPDIEIMKELFLWIIAALSLATQLSRAQAHCSGMTSGFQIGRYLLSISKAKRCEQNGD